MSNQLESLGLADFIALRNQINADVREWFSMRATGDKEILAAEERFQRDLKLSRIINAEYDRRLTGLF